MATTGPTCQVDNTCLEKSFSTHVPPIHGEENLTQTTPTHSSSHWSHWPGLEPRPLRSLQKRMVRCLSGHVSLFVGDRGGGWLVGVQPRGSLHLSSLSSVLEFPFLRVPSQAFALGSPYLSLSCDTPCLKRRPAAAVWSVYGCFEAPRAEGN